MTASLGAIGPGVSGQPCHYVTSVGVESSTPGDRDTSIAESARSGLASVSPHPKPVDATRRETGSVSQRAIMLNEPTASGYTRTPPPSQDARPQRIPLVPIAVGPPRPRSCPRSFYRSPAVLWRAVGTVEPAGGPGRVAGGTGSGAGRRGGRRRPCRSHGPGRGSGAVPGPRRKLSGRLCRRRTLFTPGSLATRDVIFPKLADRYRPKLKFGEIVRPNTDRYHPKAKFDRNLTEILVAINYPKVK